MIAIRGPVNIKNWKTANEAVGWYQTLSNVGWIIAGVLNPIGAGARYLGTWPHGAVTIRSSPGQLDVETFKSQQRLTLRND